MVKGLDVFKNHFASYTENYSIIGGVACMIAFEKVGLSFRATKDLDIVLFVEVWINVLLLLSGILLRKAIITPAKIVPEKICFIDFIVRPILPIPI
jgi:hypothetical protein